MGSSINFNAQYMATTDSKPAPAVISSKLATKHATNLKAKLEKHLMDSKQIQVAKSNLQTSYDLHGNMVKTGGLLPHGAIYSHVTPKGAPGYIPNPAEVAQQSQKASEEKKSQQEFDNEQALLAISRS